MLKAFCYVSTKEWIPSTTSFPKTLLHACNAVRSQHNEELVRRGADQPRELGLHAEVESSLCHFKRVVNVLQVNIFGEGGEQPM
jgi:hypothetical protein